MAKVNPVDPCFLRLRCDPNQFSFETTADLETLEEIIGQTRAIEAVQFGIGIRREGYNLFAMGAHGTGKHTAVTQFLTQQAAGESLPVDWCYVYNFEQSHKPRALQLPPGRAIELQQDLKNLIEELRAAIPAVFESEDYRTRKQSIEQEFQEQEETFFTKLQRQAKARELTLLRTPAGLAFAPARDGQTMSPDQFQQLPSQEQQRIEADVAELQRQLQASFQELARWEREYRNRLKTLNREIALLASDPLLAELRQKYQDLPDLIDYLNAVQQDVADKVDTFRHPKDEQADTPLKALLPASMTEQQSAFDRYQVNVLVDHSKAQGAPIIYEDHPTFQNLIGRVEHLVGPMGALITNFNLIKAGALHRANGGYLILDARKVLLQPYAWEELKRALRSGEIRIESLSQIFGLVSTISLEPEPIPLEVKIVLLGERLLYYLLYQFDPDFAELFKVVVDFEEEMGRTDHQQLYARLIGSLARKEDLHPFDRGGVASVIEHSARMTGDAEKLSTHMQGIADLLREADYWATKSGREVVRAADVQQAIDAQIGRTDRLRTRIQEEIQRGTILIDTSGEQIGQVNGLSVLSLGNYAFGRPSRITARVRLGRGEVLDIERKVELGGPLHAKGVLILSGFLGARYVPDRPLSLSASLVFEQSYSGVEGDSASSAELYALLSALAEVPIKQSLAVTGSVNQRGQVQAIGGVNEKIEGFFEICRARGLTGEQGVLIPAANVKHLMLRTEVVEAVSAGQFQVYPVETIDQGIELLTGLPAGERDENGCFPEGTFNHRVETRLIALAETWRSFAESAPGAESREDEHERARA